jgi:surfactin synthase thioesterase subunit
VRKSWTEALATPRDAFFGSSMGGWMATLLASHTGTPAWLVNPAVIGRTIEPTFPEGLGPHRPEVYVLFGRQDDLIDPHLASEWLERNGFSVTATSVDEGHRIEPPAFKAWIDQIS